MTRRIRRKCAFHAFVKENIAPNLLEDIAQVRRRFKLLVRDCSFSELHIAVIQAKCWDVNCWMKYNPEYAKLKDNGKALSYESFAEHHDESTAAEPNKLRTPGDWNDLLIMRCETKS